MPAPAANAAFLVPSGPAGWRSRRERVERLAAAVATRTYHPDARAVAAAVLARAADSLLH